VLVHLKVENFALVQEANIDFREGLSVFTGETGAGKSLLLNSILMLLGVRKKKNWSNLEGKAIFVEGAFDFSSRPDKWEKLCEMGFAEEDACDEAVIVRRKIDHKSSIKSKIWIQGKLATRQQLQDLLGDWVEISGQHEFLRLLDEEFMRQVLDKKALLHNLVSKYKESYSLLSKKQKEKKDLEEALLARQEKKEFLDFQFSELERLGVHESLAEEEEKLEDQRSLLKNQGAISKNLEKAKSLLRRGGSSDLNLLAAIQNLRDILEDLKTVDKRFAPLCENAKTAYFSIEEVDASLSKGNIFVGASSDLDKEEIESRLSELARLKRKHRCSTGELIELKNKIQSELDLIKDPKKALQKLDLEIAKYKKEAMCLAEELFEKRSSIAKKITTKWQKEIRQLGMAEAQIKIVLTKRAELNEKGLASIEVYFQANPGFELRPIAELASGGELSRVMLSLKSIVSSQAELGVFLFDEIDTGLGGEVAHFVAKRLKTLAQDNQVLVVTHLPQVAAMADGHYVIEKTIAAKKSMSQIKELQKKSEREQELARMLGGSRSSEAKKLAKAMLA